MISNWLRLRVLLLIATLASPVPLAAKQDPAVSIRSGEHQGFSRLVFHFDPARRWQIKRSGEGHIVTFSGPGLELVAADVFFWIPRDRIKSIVVNPDQSSILLRSDCDCPARAWLDRPGYLVVDVADPAFFGELGNVEFAQAEVADVPPPVAPVEPPAVSAPGMESAAKNSLEGAAMSELQRPSVPSNNVSPSDPNTEAMPNVDRLAETRDLILRELARAASQGLLEPDPEGVEAQRESGLLEGARAPLGEFGLDQLEAILKDLPNARAETAIDRNMRGNRPANRLTADGQPCLPDSFFEIASWSDRASAFEMVGQNRRALLGEFDAENPNAARRLAKVYVFLTFGAEAQAVIDLARLDDSEARVLRTIAQIVDHYVAERPGLLGGQISCPGAAAFWSALAVPEFHSDMNVNQDAILRTASALPLHLRRHLGPPLALRFLEAGNRDAALAIRDAIGRAIGPHGEGFEFLEANISRDLGRPETAAEQLDSIVSGDGSLAAEALIERVDMAIETGGDLPKDVVDLVAALAFEQRGTRTGAELARAYVLANIVVDQFDEALTSLIRIETGEAAEDEIFPELWSQLVLGMARTDDDVDFLGAYYKHRTTLKGRAVSDPARAELANRLVILGFGSEALDELGNLNDQSIDETAFLRARALVAVGQLDTARELLGELDLQSAQALLARVDERASRFDSAARIYRRLENTEAQVGASWRAGDWQEVLALGEGPKRQAAELMLAEDPFELSAVSESTQPTSGGSPVSGVIAENEALLRHSSWVRSALGELLTE